MGMWQTKEQLQDLLCRVVSIPSVTGSQAEVTLPKYLAEQFGKLSYFEQHPDHIKCTPTGDGRFFVTALVKQNEDVQDTIILVSHYDVVDVQDFGVWKDLAFSPAQLTSQFYDSKEAMPEEVQKDMETGNWLFGRGTMDMKCGLVLHMSMIERACRGEFPGNLLLLTVPDEEVNSVGMRAAVPELVEIAEKYNLQYKTVLNSEPVFTRYPGDQNKYIYMGSIGKVLPGFLCYGKETHVGEPFSGLNANYMASELTRELELDTTFCEIVEGEGTPPPTNLIQKSLKKDYSVQIPHKAVTLFNLFLLERTMEEVVDSLRMAANKVADRIQENYQRRSAHFSTLQSFVPPTMKVNVLTYQELHEYAIATYGKQRVLDLMASVQANRKEKDDRDATIEIVDELADLCKERSPMIVIFFAPPYYPAVCSRKNEMIRQVVADIVAYANERHHVDLQKQYYFGGISDLSYVGNEYDTGKVDIGKMDSGKVDSARVDSRKLDSGAESGKVDSYVANMPLWEKGYSLPLSALDAFRVPVLNLGPFGKDAHKWTERLDTDYAFNTAHDLIVNCIHKLFAYKGSGMVAGAGTGERR
jgi:arginine utilization protein RocB